MLYEKRINEIKSRIKKYQEDKIVIKESPRFTEFFLDNSRNSLDSAKLLFEISNNEKLKSSLGFYNFNGFLWVINTSYYSMFYIVRALLESQGIKIKTEIAIHSITFDALVYYLFLNNKLEKRLIEDFKEAGEEASEILGREKAKELIDNYFNEKEKRTKFTYEIEEIAMKNKAQTSLERAKKFNEEIRKIIGV